jgi:hypothetical protein
VPPDFGTLNQFAGGMLLLVLPAQAVPLWLRLGGPAVQAVLFRKEVTMRKCWLIAAALALMLGALGPPAIAADDEGPPKEKPAAANKAAAEKEQARPFKLARPLTFKLEEVSAFGKVEIDGRTIQRYAQGQYARCEGEPSKAVKAYPKLTSKQPLYGVLRFDGSYYDATQGKALHFVLDQSGEQPKPAEEKKEADAKTMVVIPNEAEKYDRLYIDLNGDGDLTNDRVLKLGENPPFEGLMGRANQRAFESFSLPVDYGTRTGVKPFEMIASLAFVQRSMGIIYFTAPTCRRGKIKIDEQEFVAELAQTRMLSGRYDRPFVELRLTPLGEATKTAQLLQANLSGVIGQIRQIDGQWTVTSASPTGDRLTIAPYRGDFGVLEIGSGGRAITELGIVGTLASRTTMVALGDPRLSGAVELPRRFELPVGEYLPANLTVQYGRLRFNCRAITDDPAKPPVRHIKIQKGQPCVLSFSGKPAVDFSSPAKDASFQPGQAVMLRAMLNEPRERTQIAGLYDTTTKESETTTQVAGQTVSIAKYPRIDPTIVIRNSSNEIVAEGTMPFG